MPQRVPIGGAHVVHADGGDRLHARIDLGGADDEAPAAAYSDRADPVPVYEALAPEIIDGGTKRFRIHIRRYKVASPSFAFAPERQIDRHGDEAALGHHRGIEIGALLFDRAHRMPD